MKLNQNVLRWKDLVYARVNGTPFTVALILALIEQESSGNMYATRYEKNYKWLYEPAHYATFNIGLAFEIEQQKTSFGLLQVMGAVAREHGFRMAYLSGLLEPNIGLSYGVLHLLNMHNRWSRLENYVSAYNQGSPRKKNGVYANQAYVDSVLEKKKFWESVTKETT